MNDFNTNISDSPCTTKNHPLGYSLVFSVVAGSYNASILNLKDDLCEPKLLKKTSQNLKDDF